MKLALIPLTCLLFRAGLADKAKKRHDEAGQLGLLEDAA